MFASSSFAQTVTPKYPLECIARAVAKNINIDYDPHIPLPKLYFSSSADLREYQNSVSLQRDGDRPLEVSNTYVIATNAIYVIDDMAYYEKHERFIDDSIAHELVHYFQVVYKKFRQVDLEQMDAEMTAIFEGQNWFRDNFMLVENPAISPCDF